MVRYLEESPYGKQTGLAGMDGLVVHLARRQALELRILRELFPQERRVMKAKGGRGVEIDFDLKNDSAMKSRAWMSKKVDVPLCFWG